MKQKQLSWFERLLNFVHPANPHHRICYLCHKPIKRREHWRQVQFGWFAPVYTVEHRDCKNPLQELAKRMAQDLGSGLPFDDPTPLPSCDDTPISWSTVMKELGTENYGDLPREKIQ